MTDREERDRASTSPNDSFASNFSCPFHP